MVLDPEKENIAKTIFDKWDLDFAVVGETISEDRFLIKLDGVVKADLPLKALQVMRLNTTDHGLKRNQITS